MGVDLTWNDIEDVVEAVSVRLLGNDGLPTERPSKRRRLSDLSAPNPVPAPDALPDQAWPGWKEIATAMELNAAHGPSFVRGVARLHAEQRCHYLLPKSVGTSSMPPVNVQLQWLSATLRLAQDGVGGASREGSPAKQPQQQPSSSAQLPQDTTGLAPAANARQPLAQWPAGVPTATQLMGSQADEPAVVGAMEFVILGKDWQARKRRGKDVLYLLQFRGAAEGDEDWFPERRITREYPGGASIIAEYERALDAGELDESQQQSQQQNPGALARMSQQQGSPVPPVPVSATVPPATALGRRPNTGAKTAAAVAAAAAEPQQQERRRQGKQPTAPLSPAQRTRGGLRGRGQQPAAPSGAAGADPDTSQPHLISSDQQQLAASGAAAAAPAHLRGEGESAVAAAEQQPAEPGRASQGQPLGPTDSEWLAGGTQTQAPSADAAALQFVPFTQPSQPSKAGDGLHRQPLPVQPSAEAAAAAAAPAAAAAGVASPARGACAPLAAPAAAAAVAAAAAAAGEAAPAADAPAAAQPGAAAEPAAADPPAAVQPPVAQDTQSAPADVAEEEPPSPEVQRGVLKLLRRLSGRALQWVQAPQQREQAAVRQQQQQQQQALEPTGQQPQQLTAAGVAGAATDSAAEVSVAAPGPAAAVVQRADSSPRAAGAAEARDRSIELSDSVSEDEADEEDVPAELRALLQPDAWAGARITGARKFEDGMDITVTWEEEDGYTAVVSNELLKATPHCRLKLIEFYESKIKAVTRNKKK